ncbi:MAG TPA: histidinol-phosphate transaminase [Elusimicrobia bacterium]|nr:MAG: histidinol-phosphate transaminase [Elusimicrobia bacterium GWA2_66_18]HAZ08264.1 histidinol-phosphate transaminase [Elusimicrobiota bacterium]
MAFMTPPRRALREIFPYQPGKSIASVQRELGLRSVIKLASNENPLGPSPRAMAVYRRAGKSNALYPEGASPELRAALGRFHTVRPESVIVGNGSDEIIRLLCEAFLETEDEVVVSQHGFIRFKQQAALMGARVIEVPMTDWTHDLELMAKATSPRTKLVFVANPNNPTGTYNTSDEISALLKAAPKTALVVLDEAYFHFAQAIPGYPRSLSDLVAEHDNLVVLRTFSKAYGLAGLRVGYAVGDPELVGWLDRIRMPFNVNLPAQQACVAALKDFTFVQRTVALNEAQRAFVARGMGDLGFGVGESATNFVFARSPLPGRELFKALLRQGVIVRPLDEYGLPQFIRVSIGTPTQNKTLLKALHKALPRRSAAVA